ncbi:hypothetical protein M501DRAFT_998353 [Patellaria atrata CBS 101060]|uniref:BZIP domain-containing protein n=1 Tax=Patellaria atrata CBS 101060 TaxID=1346257 RepID=A0A9P4SGJ1_9PEZI|nr:hypothetical protein M501DRAFT_998353 [Patellaria atrata CBS 101060]
MSSSSYNHILTPSTDMNFDGMDSLGGIPFAGAELENTHLNWGDYNASTTFTPINSAGSTSTRTVSPKDLFNDPLASAPPSTAFTNLTSPDINESPYIADSYETSPLFQDNDMGHDDTWFSLFPESTNDKNADSMQRTDSNTSFTQNSSAGNSPLILDSSNRRKSSAGGSPRAVQSGAISKPRRRKGTLPPIVIADPSDKVALKRARNTLAARDSRQRKFDHVQSLEKKITEIEQERDDAIAEAEKWKNAFLNSQAQS